MRTTSTTLMAIVCGAIFAVTAQENDITDPFTERTRPQLVRNIFIIDYPSKKEQEYNYVYPAIRLMEMYMEQINMENVTCIDCPSPNPRKRQPSFEDFYNWTMDYFKEQKGTIKTN